MGIITIVGVVSNVACIIVALSAWAAGLHTVKPWVQQADDDLNWVVDEIERRLKARFN